MGNLQGGKSSDAYEITAFENWDNGSHEGTNERTPPKVSSATHLSYFTNSADQIAKERHIFQGSVAEDMEVEHIMSTPWMVPMNISQNIRTDLLLQQKPTEVPKIVSPPISISHPVLEKTQKPLDSNIPEADDECRENNTDKKKVVGDRITKEAAAILPPCSYGTFPNKSPLYPKEMDSIITQLPELPTTCSDRKDITNQTQPEDQGTGVNPTLKGPEASATSQGGSMAKSNSTALPKVTQPPNNVLMPLDGIKGKDQAMEVHPFLESSRGYGGTELPVKPPGNEDKKAEKITHQTSDTRCMTKINPNEHRLMSISHSSPFSVPIKTQVEPQFKTVICLSYADALKQSLKVTQQIRAPKSLGKDKQGLIIQQKCDGRQNTTDTEKQAITKPKAWSNVRQVNSKNPRTDSSKNLTTGPSTSPFKTMKTQQRLPWSSPQNNPKERFQFKGSQLMGKPQNFTPNNPIQFYKRQDKVQPTINSWSTGKPWERTNPQKFDDAKKDKVYQSYTIERRNKPKLACNMSPRSTLKEPVKSKAVVSTQPQDVGPQTLESTLPEKPSRKSNTSAEDTLEHPEKSDQMGKGKTPEPMPEVKQQLVAQSEMTEDKETPAKEHDDTSDLSKLCPSVHPTDANEQDLDKSLENESASEPLPSRRADNNGGVEKDDPDKAPKHRLSGRWKAFYVDTTCTMKCRCRQRPGKLPPNVIRWFSVSQNKLGEPVWITTLKVASSLVTGTKLLLDYHDLHAPETSSPALNDGPE